MRRLALGLAASLTWAVVPTASAAAAVWQWSVLVRNSLENPGEARAFLWIPPESTRVRGVILAQHNMEEVSILENPVLRSALAELDLAEVWVAPPFDHLFRFDRGAGETFEGMMGDLAEVSGYEELNDVPVVGLGHSAAASWPYYFAAGKPDRTLAALSVSGQWPYFRHPVFAPDIWGDRDIDFVPCLESMGEYESAATWSDEGLKERREHPWLPLSMLANPAQGHFASTDAKVEYLALYLRKALQHRMPEGWRGDGPPRLRPVDPTRTGWLVDRWHPDRGPRAAAAPVGEYTGDPGEAFWFFDEEIARATEEYQAAHRGLKPQLVGYVQGGRMVPQDDSHLQVTLDFTPGPDGVTFSLSGTFYDAVPPGSPRLPQWTGLPVGSPLAHATGGGPVSIDRICGPFQKLGAETFALRLQRETPLDARRYELVFAATHPGDAEYKPAVQQAHMYVPARNLEGREQSIAFPEIPDQARGTASLKLSATSDAHVPVHYVVREGPAEVDGDTLRFTPIPPRARFPVRVTVVAWQYERSVEPKLRSAEPVERVLHVVR